ncbi:MAG: hypothetical protein ACJ79G_10530, partial [Myxococcales bacterium]
EEVVAITVRAPPPEASFRAAPPPPLSASPPEPRREEPARLGSGGDVARNSPMAAPSAPPPQREAKEPAKAAPAPQPSSPMAEASNVRRNDPIEPAPKAAPPVSPSEADKFGGIAGGAVSADASSQNRLRESSLKAEQPDPDRLEVSAGEARRSGQYARAAELYQLAAGARRSANDSPRAAWDLAHAVECLAAASKLTEAGGIRAELLRSYPSEEGPRHAADRALGYPANAPH